MKTLMLLITSVASIVLRGYVLVCLWAWFIVATFQQQELSVPVAIGISLTVGWLNGTKSSRADNEREDASQFALTRSIVYSLSVLLTGYVVKQFM